MEYLRLLWELQVCPWVDPPEGSMVQYIGLQITTRPMSLRKISKHEVHLGVLYGLMHGCFHMARFLTVPISPPY